jgi:hypothetical protein
LEQSTATNAANYRLITPLGSELSNPSIDETRTRVTLDVVPPLLMYHATVLLNGVTYSDGERLEREVLIAVHNKTAIELQTGKPLGTRFNFDGSFEMNVKGSGFRETSDDVGYLFRPLRNEIVLLGGDFCDARSLEFAAVGFMARADSAANASFVALVFESIGVSRTECRLIQRDSNGQFSSEVIAEVNEPLSGRLRLLGALSPESASNVGFLADGRLLFSGKSLPLRNLLKFTQSGVVVYSRTGATNQWIALSDPETTGDPGPPELQATANGGRLTLSWQDGPDFFYFPVKIIEFHPRLIVEPAVSQIDDFNPVINVPISEPTELFMLQFYRW